MDRAYVDKYPFTLILVSAGYMTALSEVALFSCVSLAEQLGVARSVAGVVLLGVSTQVEDLVAYSAVARRRGGGSRAMAGNLSSQIVGLCVGVGLPFLVASVVRQEPVAIHHLEDAFRSVALAFASCALFAALASKGYLGAGLDVILLIGVYIVGVGALELFRAPVRAVQDVPRPSHVA